jgi:nicotinate-nucleotide pyrophosphorylase (carboxylating)
MLPRALIEDLVHRALVEDFGRAGDLTSAVVVPEEAQLTTAIVARKPGVLAGSDLVQECFRQVDPALEIIHERSDGARLGAGDIAIIIKGPARSILSGERTALNFLGHLSGIATATRALVDAVAHTKARICDTRKTNPGLRAVEKAAVRAGGGTNHRFGLDDAVLIKDNHIAAAGGITSALRRARQAVGHMIKIEIEVDTLGQLDEALLAGADAVLLDNMSLDDLREAVRRARGKAVLEASGTVTLERVAAIAETGVDLISSGWITHSAPCLDLGLDVMGAR